MKLKESSWKIQCFLCCSLALSQDMVDAVVLDSEPAKKYTANNKQFIIASVPTEEEDYAIAVRKMIKNY